VAIVWRMDARIPGAESKRVPSASNIARRYRVMIVGKRNTYKTGAKRGVKRIIGSVYALIVYRILFVCHANVCRSPIAEYVMKHLVREAGMESEFHIESAGTDPDDGCDIWPDSREIMSQKGISWEHRSARYLSRDEYGSWDRIVVMDYANLADAKERFDGDPEGKVSLLRGNRAVADPYYNGDFDTAFEDIHSACKSLLADILRKGI